MPIPNHCVRWLRACGGKVRYPTHAEAVAGLERSETKGMVSYPCPCGGWHNGHPNRRYLDPEGPAPRPAFRTRSDIW